MDTGGKHVAGNTPAAYEFSLITAKEFQATQKKCFVFLLQQ